MPTKIPSAIAGLSTFFLLIATAVLLVFGQVVMLNGVSESQGFNAISIAVICQSVSLFPAVILARWLTKLLMTKFNWNAFLAVIVAIIASVGLGASLLFVSIIVGTLAVGIK
ncbi:MAG: hypothetical protein IPP66_09825 [Anaerolineales bacterium]|nr:hypothetical protein [Anaerolineales bacterium]